MIKIRKITNFNSELLDIVMKDPDYVLFYGNAALTTPDGQEIAYHNERLIQHLLVELSVTGKLSDTAINSMVTFFVQKDLIETNKDPIIEYIKEVMEEDFFIQMKISGQKESKVFKVDNILDFFIENNHVINLIFLGVSSVQKAISQFFKMGEAEGNGSTERLLENVRQTYIELSAEKRAVVNTLCVFHDAGIMLPLLLVNESITASEYSNALFAIQLNKLQSGKKYSEFNEITQGKIVAKVEYPDWKDPIESFTTVHTQALQSLEYLTYFSTSEKQLSGLMELIHRGESHNLEFKSTLRWNIKAERKDPAIEHASLKTISAFLNSSGGILLIGVEDDGHIIGTELDKFDNEDRYLLHLWNLIKSSMGQDIGQYVNVTIEDCNEKHVCKIVCSRSSRPVFLKQKGYDEEFYIRLGPSSANLHISEALKYIADRFTEDSK